MRKLTFILSLLLVAAACGTGDPVAPSASSSRPARNQLQGMLSDSLPPLPQEDSASVTPATTNGDGGIMIGGGN